MTSNLPVPEWFDVKQIAAKYLEGKDTDAIAKDLGVSRHKLVHYLTKHNPDDWKDAQVIRQIRRMEEAEDEIDSAASQGDYTKAKAYEIQLRSAQWALDKVLTRIYGEQREKPQANPVQININLRRNDVTTQDAAKTVEAVEADVIEQSPNSDQPAAKKKQHMVYVPPSPRPDEILDYPNIGVA